MERKDYNGWTNYETWLTALWIDKDPYTSEELRGASAETLKDWYHHQIDVLFPQGDGLFSDILNTHSREVNWEEIAERCYVASKLGDDVNIPQELEAA